MHHEHFGEPRFCDPGDRASYSAHPIDEIEPLSDEPNPYRAAALASLRVLLAIDAYMMDAENPRLAWITVAITFDLTSIRGLPLAEIATQLGVTPATISRSAVRFREMAGLDADTGSVPQFAQSRNGDKPLNRA